MNTERSRIHRARIRAALGEPARLAVVDALVVVDASPGEVGEALGLATNLVAHHVKVLAEAGIIVRGRSEGDRRRTYLRLVPEALHNLLPPTMQAPPRVVFVCTHNSARSRFAAALWSRRSTVPAYSAGTHPVGRVHTCTVEVARRHELSLDHAAPRHTAFALMGASLVSDSDPFPGPSRVGFCMRNIPIPVDTNRLSFVCVAVPRPRLVNKDTGEVKVDKQGHTVFQVGLSAAEIDSGRVELINVNVSGDPHP